MALCVKVTEVGFTCKRADHSKVAMNVSPWLIFNLLYRQWSPQTAPSLGSQRDPLAHVGVRSPLPPAPPAVGNPSGAGAPVGSHPHPQPPQVFLCGTRLQRVRPCCTCWWCRRPISFSGSGIWEGTGGSCPLSWRPAGRRGRLRQRGPPSLIQHIYPGPLVPHGGAGEKSGTKPLPPRLAFYKDGRNERTRETI